MLRLDQLTADELETIEMVVEEGLDQAQHHLEWLDGPDGLREDNRLEQQAGTQARIAILKKVLGR